MTGLRGGCLKVTGGNGIRFFRRTGTQHTYQLISRALCLQLGIESLEPYQTVFNTSVVSEAMANGFERLRKSEEVLERSR